MDALQTREALDIRPLTGRELAAVERGLPRFPDKHRERLASQNAGDCVYLIAWSGSRPVGHLNLRLGGRKLSERAREVEAAQVEDVRVSPEYQRRGIGSELMRRAHAEADARGFRALGLGVDVDNHPARALYRREGYEESGTGRFVVTYPYLDDQGVERRARETCTYLVKRLT